MGVQKSNNSPIFNISNVNRVSQGYICEVQVITENLEKIEYQKKKLFHSSPDFQFARITDHSLFLRKRNTEPVGGGRHL